MALGSVGSLRQFSTTSASSADSLTTSVDLPDNDAVIFIDCTDNESATGLTNDHVSATIDGHALTKLHEYTFSPGGAAGDGSTTSLWMWKNNTGATIPAGALIDVNYSGSIKARSSLAYTFSTSPGTTLAFAGADEDGSGNGTAFRTLNINPGVLREYLFVRGIAQQVINSGAFSPTPGWTAFPLVGQSGGSSSQVMALRGEFLIATATNESSTPTGNTNQSTSCGVAIYEVSTTTTVGKSVSLPYKIRKLIGKSSQLPFDVDIAIGLSRLQKYNIGGLVSAARLLKYDLRKLVSADYQLPYQLAELVGIDGELPFEVREVTSKLVVLLFKIRKPIFGFPDVVYPLGLIIEPATVSDVSIDSIVGDLVIDAADTDLIIDQINLTDLSIDAVPSDLTIEAATISEISIDDAIESSVSIDDVDTELIFDEYTPDQ